MIDVGPGFRLLLPTEEPMLGDERHYSSPWGGKWISITALDLDPTVTWRTVVDIEDFDDGVNLVQHRIFRRRLK